MTHKPSPWGNTPEKDAKTVLEGAKELLDKHRDEISSSIMDLKVAVKNVDFSRQKLQNIQGDLPRIEEVLDLFPNIFDRLDHVVEDLEDIQAGKPFRHGGYTHS
jgi:predicted nuclease with TOPRIM domain